MYKCCPLTCQICEPTDEPVVDACPENCLRCEGTECGQCQRKFVFDYDGICVGECPRGQFADHESGYCVECHESCSLCRGPDGCEECAEGYFKEDD